VGTGKNTSITLLVWLLVGLFIVIIGLGWQMYRLGRLNFLTFDKITVISQVDGVSANFTNKPELEKYLDQLGFWQGVVSDSDSMTVTPKKLVIHITDQEYSNTWFRQADGSHLASAWAEATGDTFHLYLGFNPRLFTETGKFDRLVDTMIFEAVYQRTSGINGSYAPWALEMRNKKKETDPFISLGVNNE
jgi:hypothetical protein